MALSIDVRRDLAQAATRDQLYEVPTVFQILKQFNKYLSVETLSTRVFQQNIYNGSQDSFVVGHPVNGVIGVANGIGGTQVVIGNYHGTDTLKRVTNPNNTFKDFIRDTLHWDTTNSTATVDTTNYKIIF